MKFKHACAAAMAAVAYVAAGPAAAQLSESVAVIVNDDVISTYVRFVLDGLRGGKRQR